MDYTGHLSLNESQIGAVYVIDGQVVGMDCFGKPETSEKVFAKLVESNALDAIDTPDSKEGSKIEKRQVSEFVYSPTTCRVEPPSACLGKVAALNPGQSWDLPWRTTTKSCTCRLSPEQEPKMKKNPFISLE